MNDATSHPPLARASLSSRILRNVLSILAVLMCALALGAVIALIDLWSGIRPCWTMLIGAPLLAWVLRISGSLRGRYAAILAVIAVLLSGAYAECLDALARVAAVTGVSLADSLRLGGVGLAAQLAELALSPLTLIVYAVAALLAAWQVSRPSS